MKTVYAFDEFTKALAGDLRRRDALVTIGSALLGAILGSTASVSRGANKPPGRSEKECHAFCSSFPKNDQAKCRATCLSCPPGIPLCGTTAQTLSCCSSFACVA